MPSKVWYEITYPFLNFNGTVSLGRDVQFNSTLYDGRVYWSMPGLKLIHVSKTKSLRPDGALPCVAEHPAIISSGDEMLECGHCVQASVYYGALITGL